MFARAMVLGLLSGRATGCYNLGVAPTPEDLSCRIKQGIQGSGVQLAFSSIFLVRKLCLRKDGL